MTDSTPHLLLEETAGTGPATPYGGAGRRAVLPQPATNPAIGQSPASPYTAGLTEPLVRRAAAPRSVSSPPPPVSPVDLTTPVPAPSPARLYEEVARLEEPSPNELSPVEVSPTEPSPTELSPTEPEPEDATTEAAPIEDPDPVEEVESVDSVEDVEPFEPSLEDVPSEDPSAVDLPLETVEPVEAEADDEDVAEASPVVPDDAEASPVVPDDAEANPVVPDDALDEPVAAAPEPAPLTSIPLIDRAPTPNASHSLSAAQAYTAPIDPSMWFIGPMEESQAPPFVRVRRQGPERVDRGLLFAAVPLVIGCALSAALFHFGHIPSIVALAMGPAGALLYGKGAGSRPQAGAVKLVALLVVGVLLAWPVSLATELFMYYQETTGTVSGAVEYVASSMFSASLFMAKLKELLLVALFGLGGVIAVVQTMVAASRKRRRSAAES